MKLTCELCGDELQMCSGGQSARCVGCGMEYPKARLMEMLNGDAPVQTEHAVQTGGAQMRYLFLERKFSFCGAGSQAHFYLDGQHCAALGAKGQASVLVSEGTHELQICLATNSGVVTMEMQPVTFHVRNRDLRGLFYLKRGAITANWVFEVIEL